MSVPDTPRGSVIDAAAGAAPVMLDELAPGSGTVLIVVPHPDDESLGCGMALAAAADAGRGIAILLLTDGEGSHPGSRRWPPERVAALRLSEMQAALEQLAGPAPVALHRLRLPDGRVTPGMMTGDTRRAAERFARDHGAGAVWSTWARDPHCDHESAAALASDLARTLDLPHWSFAVWGRFGKRPLDGCEPRPFHSPAHLERKARAIAAHRSQVTPLIRDDPDGFTMPPALRDHFARHPEIVFHEHEPRSGRTEERVRQAAHG